MTREELLEAMDEEFGPGAGARWAAHEAKQEARVLALCEDIGFGYVIQTAQRLWDQRQPIMPKEEE